MEIPKISNSPKVFENNVPEITGDQEKHQYKHGAPFQEEDKSSDQGEVEHYDFFRSYLTESENVAVSTIEWLGTWRPIL
tara:strand:+ start:1496 stop:1732 length:237 start_codon:yes stop_codon:yes gene_type:complete